MGLTHWIRKRFLLTAEQEPEAGYDLWSGSYDDQPDNLVLKLDEEIFSSLVQGVKVENKTIGDIGCGTGRHWKKIYSLNPGRLIGYDVSEGMLQQLKKKYPHAETYLLRGNHLPASRAGLFDVMISTLTLAHIDNPEAALSQWDKALKPRAGIIITDYHPEALKRDAKRTFKHGGKTISLKSHIYTIDTIRKITKQLGWTEVRFIEKQIDEMVKPFYEKQNALALYQKFSGMPLIYGIHLMKGDDTP